MLLRMAANLVVMPNPFMLPPACKFSECTQYVPDRNKVYGLSIIVRVLPHRIIQSAALLRRKHFRYTVLTEEI
jgi:hypothetical protein